MAAVALFGLDRAFPPDVAPWRDVSVTVTDKDDRPLSVFLNGTDKWRQPATAADVSPLFVNLLLAYEDQRFYHHPGIDPLAVGRAMVQNLTHGRVVSGASTLTMQVARLLDPHPRGWGAKLRQAARALQLEARYDKQTLLSMYLTLAPYGGNVEGVRAASAVWFGKRASELTPGEAALLVALPRSPAALRPDRGTPENLRTARDGVIDRAEELGMLDHQRAAEARAEPLPATRRPLPQIAAHAARRVAALHPDAPLLRTTLDGGLQQAVEAAVLTALAEQGEHVGIAALVVDNKTRKVRAYVGAPAPFDTSRLGAIDMVGAVRSPGSALKPFVYGMSFAQGLLHPETLVSDVSTRFGAYVPQNFDRGFHGDLTITEALQRSLNVPAVLALQKVGPQHFWEAVEQAGVRLTLPKGDTAPGLPLVLGGVGVSLWDMASLYVALANDGKRAPLLLEETGKAEGAGRPERPPVALMTPEAARAVLRILEGTPPPEGLLFGAESRARTPVALKTGTSFGFRDAWAFGVSATHTVGVWVGRPDGTPVPGRYGVAAAAPIVYRLFDLLPPTLLRPSGAGALPGLDGNPASMLQRVRAGRQEAFAPRDPLRLVFPTSGLVIDRPTGPAAGQSLQLEARGGHRPLTWLVDGRPLERASALARGIAWTPPGPGVARVTVMDAGGAAASAVVEIR